MNGVLEKEEKELDIVRKTKWNGDRWILWINKDVIKRKQRKQSKYRNV